MTYETLFQVYTLICVPMVLTCKAAFCCAAKCCCSALSLTSFRLGLESGILQEETAEQKVQLTAMM